MTFFVVFFCAHLHFCVGPHSAWRCLPMESEIIESSDFPVQSDVHWAVQRKPSQERYTSRFVFASPVPEGEAVGTPTTDDGDLDPPRCVAYIWPLASEMWLLCGFASISVPHFGGCVGATSSNWFNIG